MEVNLMGMGKYNSPKIDALLNWEKIKEVNMMLDEEVSPAKVCQFINENGFKISAPMVYEYRDFRKAQIANDLSMESAINPIDRNALFKSDQESYIITKGVIKNELTALDEIINRGWKDMLDKPDLPVTPQLMMKAIEVKNNITKGGHDHLTNYGIQDIKTIEQGKFKAVLSALLTFVPEEQRDAAIQAIDTAEENFYKNTEYYSEFLKAKEQQEKEIDPDGPQNY
jgi:hypothetical protein